MIPPIKIQISGNSCWCCTSDPDPKEYRIIYRADKNIFVAVPDSQVLTMSAIVATREALNVILQENYFVTLDQVHPTSTPNSPLSFGQIKKIEELASKKMKQSSSDSL